MLDTANYTPRLKAQYRETIKAALMEEFGYKNVAPSRVTSEARRPSTVG